MSIYFIAGLLVFMLFLEAIAYLIVNPKNTNASEHNETSPPPGEVFRIITEQEVKEHNRNSMHSFMCKNCGVTKNSLEVVRQYCDGCGCWLCYNCNDDLCGECKQKTK